MGIRDEANGLDDALKKSTSSARALSFAIAEGTNNIHGAVRATEMLAEAFRAVATSEKAAQTATIIGAIATAIVTAVGAVTMWKSKQRELTQAIDETRNATRAFNAEAANNPRLAQEIRIRSELEKQTFAVKEQMKALFGAEGALHRKEFERQLAALNANARAQIRALNAAIARSFGDTQFDIRTQTGRISDAFIYDPDEVARREAGRERARQLREMEGKGYTDEQIAQRTKDITDQYNEAIRAIPQNKFRPIGEQLGLSFARSLADGIAKGIQSGSIGKGFRALAGGILSAFGEMLIAIGEKTLLASALIKTIVDSLKKLDGTGGVLASLALIAFGGVLEGLGGGMSGGFGGGGGGYGGGGGGGVVAAGGTLIDRGFIYPASPASSIQAVRPVVNVNYIIGPADPMAQRMFDELSRRSANRGSLG